MLLSIDAVAPARTGLVAVSVFGLGYVGCVSAACLAARGHMVIGVDANPDKIQLVRRGQAPVVEERIGELTAQVVGSGSLTVSNDPADAVQRSDVSIVCVGTPSRSGGGLSTLYLESVSKEIGEALAVKDGWHIVVLRSTMVPGTCENLIIPILEKVSGKKAGVDFGVCVNPEFLREGTSVRDFENPPKIVVGESDEYSGSVVMGLYDGLDAPRFRVPIAVAEMTKYVDNGFHALKVTFGNEIGTLCAALGLDSHAVMDIFLADTKLKITGAYLRPGFAFGGSCLPKDVRALTHTARQHDVELPVLANVLVSNEMQIRRVVDKILDLASGRSGSSASHSSRGRMISVKARWLNLRSDSLERVATSGFTTRMSHCQTSWAQTTPTWLRSCRTFISFLPTTSMRYFSTAKSSSPEPKIHASLPRSTELMAIKSSST